MEKILMDKVIVVSGGTKGLGRGVILESAKNGAKVVIGGRDRNAAEMILKQVSELGSEGIFVYTDLQNCPDDCTMLFDKTIEKFGKVDGFVNYSGLMPEASLLDSTPEIFHTVFNVNVLAPLMCAKACVKYMQQNGGGSIIMVGSPHAWRGEKNRTIYAMSKGALLTLSEHITYHYAVNKIRCNFLTMGWVPTDGELEVRVKQGLNSEMLHDFAKDILPMGRMQEVDDHVPGVIYLLSDYASQVTGSNLRVTGGFYI